MNISCRIILDVTLRNLVLKDEYRSDRDDLISEFLAPCLGNCNQFDRSIEFVTAKSVTAILGGFQNIVDKEVKIRIVTGHRFNSEDLGLLTKILDDIKKNRQSYKENSADFETYDVLKKIIQTEKLQIKIAIPRSDNRDGFFAENVGIFKDLEGNSVVFRGMSNETFSNNKNFESIDVFTSWKEKSRTETKIRNFEDLWNDTTSNVRVYDIQTALKNKLLRYNFRIT